MEFLKICGVFDFIFDDCFVFVGEDVVRFKVFNVVFVVVFKCLVKKGFYV